MLLPLPQVPSGWGIVVNYYQNVESKKWIPWSKPVVTTVTATGTKATGQYGTKDWQLQLTKVRRIARYTASQPVTMTSHWAVVAKRAASVILDI